MLATAAGTVTLPVPDSSWVWTVERVKHDASLQRSILPVSTRANQDLRRQKIHQARKLFRLSSVAGKGAFFSSGAGPS